MLCKPAGTATLPGAHPICCTDPLCLPQGKLCEHGDGSVGACGGGGCQPKSCTALGVKCGTEEDGCGALVHCGECPPGQSCDGGACVEGCIPSCEGKECGDDGCNGTCGICPEPMSCSPEGLCTSSCVLACLGKECGDDGCGGSCGTCPAGIWCSPDTWTCEAGACQLPTVFTDPSQRANQLAIGAGGYPSEALDVDLDPGTCAPSGNCEDGLDNQICSLLDMLSAMGGVDMADMLQEMVDSGALNLICEPQPQDPGLHLALFYGMADNLACSQVCDFWVAASSFDPDTCLPLILFDNVVLNGNALTAGGPDYSFNLPISIGLVEDPMVLMIQRARIEASVTLSAGGDIQAMIGVIGGAVPEQTIYDAIEVIPEDQLPMGKDLILSMLDMFLNSDIDLDEDGQADAVSIGVKFTSGPAHILGVDEIYYPY